MTTTRILARGDIGRIAAEVGLDRLMDEMIDELTAAVRNFDADVTDVRERDGFDYTQPHVGLLEWMPVMERLDRTTIKMVGYHPANPQNFALPTILSTIAVYDNATGHLVAVADGTFLTALRTGAASALASRALASPQSRTLGLIGCGAQAVTQVHALVRSFDLSQILITDTDPGQVESFGRRVDGLLPPDVEIRPAPIDLLVQSADILCTATSIDAGEGPLFGELQTREWLHINAVGSDFPGKQELPVEMLQRALVCPDHREQAIKEGECQQLDPDTIGPDLAELVRHPAGYAQHRQSLTVFDSTGWALEDQVAAKILLGYAEDLDLGEFVEIEDVGDDPYDPYEVVGGRQARLPFSRRLRRRPGA